MTYRQDGITAFRHANLTHHKLAHEVAQHSPYGKCLLEIGTPGAIKEFDTWLKEGAAQSPAFNRLLREIGQEKDPLAQVIVIVREHPPHVLGDLYRTGEVDSSDIRQFPTKPPPERPNNVTRTEIIAHFLAERRYAAVHPGGFGPGADNNESHKYGIVRQNEVRKDLKQGLEVRDMGLAPGDAVFQAYFQIIFINGTAQTIPLIPFPTKGLPDDLLLQMNQVIPPTGYGDSGPAHLPRPPQETIKQGEITCPPFKGPELRDGWNCPPHSEGARRHKTVTKGKPTLHVSRKVTDRRTGTVV
jgi:hypothetical protein